MSAGQVTPAELAESFSVEQFVPDLKPLHEGVAWEDFVRIYGSADDERFLRYFGDLRRRVEAMPAYRSSDVSIRP